MPFTDFLGFGSTMLLLVSSLNDCLFGLLADFASCKSYQYDFISVVRSWSERATHLVIDIGREITDG